MVNARYSWPAGDELSVSAFGGGAPTVAVGMLAHSNEPLGTAFASALEEYDGAYGSIALIGPIDPPPPAHRFALPCELRTFLRDGYLPPLAEQVEFAHTDRPATAAQRRAARLREIVADLRPALLVLVHNDAFSRFPYLYANEPQPELERALREELGREPALAYAPLPAAGWTQRVGPLTYAYFPCDRIGVHGTESAGVFIPRQLGIPTLTVELPMFDWCAAPLARSALREAMGRWIAAGGALADRTEMLALAGRLLAGAAVPMLEPILAVRALDAVVRSSIRTARIPA